MIKILESGNKRAFELKVNEIGEDNIVNLCTRGREYVCFYMDKPKKKVSAPKPPTKTELAAKKAIELGIELKGDEKLNQIEKMIKDHEAESQADTNNEDGKVK